MLYFYVDFTINGYRGIEWIFNLYFAGPKDTRAELED
jgi:hypothetical protein